jgi:hypothetical protein
MTTEHVPSVLIKAGIRRIAKAGGKMLSKDFIAALEARVRKDVEDACHFAGDRKIVRIDELKHLATVASLPK